MKTCVVIPVHNEALAIGELVTSIKGLGFKICHQAQKWKMTIIRIFITIATAIMLI